ncbi:MAG: cytochrome c3 family protein [Nitrospiraceae bacterium]|nr:cytochrome c3 family protein [Nitrospiraceae bacterium]
MRISAVVVIFMTLCLAGVSRAAEVDCVSCHKDLTEGKTVHPAVMMGCAVCHTGVDATKVPHKFTGKLGLAAEPPDLCFNCHKREDFIAADVHPPVSMGMCTSCHNPHRSDQPKLLIAPIPDLCFNCHEKQEFTKKDVHAPVKAGQCLKCHMPHVSPNSKLLQKKGVFLCRQCHANIERQVHVVAGFSSAGHPLKGKQDPLRKGKPFECLSCHVPHSSDWGRLFRYKANDAFGLCNYCHKF